MLFSRFPQQLIFSKLPIWPLKEFQVWRKSRSISSQYLSVLASTLCKVWLGTKTSHFQTNKEYKSKKPWGFWIKIWDTNGVIFQTLECHWNCSLLNYLIICLFNLFLQFMVESWTEISCDNPQTHLSFHTWCVHRQLCGLYISFTF